MLSFPKICGECAQKLKMSLEDRHALAKSIKLEFEYFFPKCNKRFLHKMIELKEIKRGVTGK